MKDYMTIEWVVPKMTRRGQCDVQHSKEAADYLRGGRIMMHGLVFRGEVNVGQIGRCIRFHQEDLERFVKSRVTRRNRKRTITVGVWAPFGRR